MQTYISYKNIEQGWMLGCGQYSWVKMPMPSLFVFMLLTRCLMFRAAWTGRLITLNLSYGALGIMTTQSPRNPHISLVA